MDTSILETWIRKTRTYAVTVMTRFRIKLCIGAFSLAIAKAFSTCRDATTVPPLRQVGARIDPWTRSKPTKRLSSMALAALDDDLLTRSAAIARTLSYPLGFAAAFRTGAAISVINQPRLPQLPSSTTNAVGSRVIRLPTSGARVRLFYPTPTLHEPHPNDAPYCTDGRETSDGMAGLVGFRQLGLSFLLAHLADAPSGCYRDVPPLEGGGGGKGLPLLVYSHGYGGNMDMATYFLRAIASTGTVVAAVEHTDGTASSTLLGDGKRLEFSPGLMTGEEQLGRRADEVLEAADVGNLPADFSIDPSRLFLGGHSYGAPSALLAASRAAKGGARKIDVAGIILHDPALAMGYGMLEDRSKYNIPTISYTSDEYNRAGVTYGDSTIHVRGAFHGNFVDAPLWAPSWVMRPLSAVIPAAGPADPIQVHNELASSAAAFIESRQVNSATVMEGELFEYCTSPI